MKNVIKISKTQSSLFKGITIILTAVVLFTIPYACKKEVCEYTNLTNGCVLSDSINLSTGIDTSGNVITPGDGVTDPYWKLINNPPLLGSCTLSSTINGSAYVVNSFNFGPSQWVNQVGSSTLAPVDLGITRDFGCNNALNQNDDTIPYVFERSFCVLKNTEVNFHFTFKGDDKIYFELIDNSTGTVLNTSPTYNYVSPVGVWSATSLPLTAGSYSIRGYLVNIQSVVLGFSMLGNLTTTNGDLAVSNNVGGCCENNTISILNILDSNCDGAFNGSDQLGNGWTFQLKDGSNNIIKTAVTDINGNIFFSGLSDGTYTVEVVPIAPWVPNIPAGGSTTISVSNNAAKIVEFYHCK